jgi:hypothetical protein
MASNGPALDLSRGGNFYQAIRVANPYWVVLVICREVVAIDGNQGATMNRALLGVEVCDFPDQGEGDACGVELPVAS